MQPQACDVIPAGPARWQSQAAMAMAAASEAAQDAVTAFTCGSTFRTHMGAPLGRGSWALRGIPYCPLDDPFPSSFAGMELRSIPRTGLGRHASMPLCECRDCLEAREVQAIADAAHAREEVWMRRGREQMSDALVEMAQQLEAAMDRTSGRQHAMLGRRRDERRVCRSSRCRARRGSRTSRAVGGRREVRRHHRGRSDDGERVPGSYACAGDGALRGF